MNLAYLIGRIIFGSYWLMAALNHFKNLSQMSGYAKAKGTPLPNLAVAGTGVILLVGGLSMLLGVYPVVGIALVLSAVFIPTAFIPGITGRLYQQFAVTIAISVMISVPITPCAADSRHRASRRWTAAAIADANASEARWS